MEISWFHVVPVNDTSSHNTSGKECDCQPVLKHDDRLVLHNAWDNREFDEMEIIDNVALNGLK